MRKHREWRFLLLRCFFTCFFLFFRVRKHRKFDFLHFRCLYFMLLRNSHIGNRKKMKIDVFPPARKEKSTSEIIIFDISMCFAFQSAFQSVFQKQVLKCPQSFFRSSDHHRHNSMSGQRHIPRIPAVGEGEPAVASAAVKQDRGDAAVRVFE